MGVALKPGSNWPTRATGKHHPRLHAGCLPPPRNFGRNASSCLRSLQVNLGGDFDAWSAWSPSLIRQRVAWADLSPLLIVLVCTLPHTHPENACPRLLPSTPRPPPSPRDPQHLPTAGGNPGTFPDRPDSPRFPPGWRRLVGRIQSPGHLGLTWFDLASAPSRPSQTFGRSE